MWRDPQPVVPSNIQVYKKSSETEEYVTRTEKQKKKKGKKGVQNETADSVEAEPELPKEILVVENGTTDVKKKTKYVSLFDDKGDARTTAKLPGRHICECQASKHKLINNCLQCGRVICDQEGSGPCLFCGSLVCTSEEREVLNRGSRKSEKLRIQLMSKGEAEDALPHASAKQRESYEKATAQKDRLLEYDRTSVKRTQVIDDESDYFATDTNQWLSDTEKKALRKREEELRSVRHASRKDRKITLDFAGRRVLEEKNSVDMYSRNDSVIQAVHYGKGSLETSEAEPRFTDEDFGDLVNPNIKQEAPQFVETRKRPSQKPLHGRQGDNSNTPPTSALSRQLRIQDREMQEMSDEGKCMSMHQPWASLLIRGIKRHEGRTWYSAHRGRLWIAATAKPPDPDAVSHLQEDYRSMYPGTNLDFPKDYPVSCLLGCVDVTNVLDETAYRQEYPDGESSSPYVFVCENPQELMVKFPIKGKHKIYSLERHTHQAAKKGLRHS